MNTQESRPASGPVPDTGAAGPAGDPSGLPAAEFFDRIRSLGVVRPDQGRWAAGVCAGLARRWNLDPLLVRGLFVVAGIVSGIGLGLYGLLWLFLPHPDGRIHAQQVMRGTVTSGFVASVLFVLIDFPLSGGMFGWGGGWGHPFGGIVYLALIGFGIWWFVNRGQHHLGGWSHQGASGTPGAPGESAPGHGAGSGPAGFGSTQAGPTSYGTPGYGTPDPARPAGGPETETYGYGAASGYGQGYRPGSATAPAPVVVPPSPAPRVDVHRPLHSLTFATLGAAGLAVAGVLIWDRAIGAVPEPVAVVALAVALGVVALGIVLAGSLGRRAGGLAPIAIVLAIAAANGAAWNNTNFDQNLTWAPVSAPTTSYSLGAGRAVLDLTGPALVRGATSTSPVTVPASLGAGELVVVVPRGVATEVNASVGLGNITDDVDRAGGINRGGAGIDEQARHGGTPVIVVNAEVGVGRIWIVPQGTDVTR